MAPLPKRLLQDLANLTASREAQESEMDSGQGPAGTAAAEEEEEEEEVDDDEFQREVGRCPRSRLAHILRAACICAEMYARLAVLWPVGGRGDGLGEGRPRVPF
eukprot:jgi/Mesen1/10972/ME000096S10560